MQEEQVELNDKERRKNQGEESKYESEEQEETGEKEEEVSFGTMEHDTLNVNAEIEIKSEKIFDTN